MTKHDDEYISDEQASEGMNEIFEIINAKGDEGELREIVKNRRPDSSQESEFTQAESAYQSIQPSQGAPSEHNLTCSEELFYTDLRAIAEDSSRED